MADVAEITAINGPVLTVRGENFRMAEMVSVNGLPGEVIALKPNAATIQLYESTAGLRPGTPVEKTGAPMSVTLRPGIIGGIFDGIMRDLEIDHRFLNQPVTNRNRLKKFKTRVVAKYGQNLSEGDVFAAARETEKIIFKATVPPGVFGEVIRAAEDGEFSPDDEILALWTSGGEKILTLSQTWPIRIPRPVRRRFSPEIPLITGIRVIDSLFPLAKGGTCVIPGGFGTGKTMAQHQIAKFCDADVIIYIGCGERGNEMTEVLESFARLADANGVPLLSRTVLVANTSDMPVAAREASIYTGITLAEFYRDMGYDVAVMADSTSRWAEALRELGARLEEIPAEEGYPAYLAARLAAFYSRAGAAENLGGTRGSVTIIGAVSPQGGDFTEPVTLHTKRFARCFWALDKNLAHARQFPAINPLQSYSRYELDAWFAKNVHKNFPDLRAKILEILREENALQEIIKLTGTDALSAADRALLNTAKKIRRRFTAQNAYNPADAHTPLAKQFEMMREVLSGYGN